MALRWAQDKASHIPDKRFKVGEVAEWLNAAVLKTVVPQGTGSSNPPLSVVSTSNAKPLAQRGNGFTQIEKRNKGTYEAPPE